MNRFLKSMSVSAIILAAVPGLAQAQSCQSGTKVASDIFAKVGTHAVAAGCSAIKIALAGEGEKYDQNDLLECYKDASFYTGLSASLTAWWNTQVAHNAWPTLGPRLLEMDKNLDGKLIGTSGRMFISFPMKNDKVTISISERDGKAKTSVVVCKHDPEGKWTQLATRWFNNTNDLQRRTNEEHNIELSGVKGYEISVHADAKSVTNTFSVHRGPAAPVGG